MDNPDITEKLTGMTVTVAVIGVGYERSETGRVLGMNPKRNIRLERVGHEQMIPFVGHNEGIATIVGGEGILLYENTAVPGAYKRHLDTEEERDRIREQGTYL